MISVFLVEVLMGKNSRCFVVATFFARPVGKAGFILLRVDHLVNVLFVVKM